MAASPNLPQPQVSGKSPISRSGVLTIHGFGVRVRMQSGHLEIDDGIGPERRTIRLARVGHGLKRLVCISEDGFTTLSALKWLGDVGASFVMLSRTGKVLLVTGPAAPSDVRLRRAQALALGNGIGLDISRTLIDAKLERQERLIRHQLNDPVTAQVIASFRNRLPTTNTFEAIRTLEAHAAIAYFSVWRNTPVLWPKADLSRIPDHWRTAGSRQSPLSGGPRLAITPVHAILNYCFALLESESRLALSSLGLDPGLGVGLHTDTPNRDSLALDVLEPVRPEVEGWLLGWITQQPFRRADFFETKTGNCRLATHLCAKLGETAPTWGRFVAPWAEYVAQRLWATTSRPRIPATRLTQQHRREAKGSAPLPPDVPSPRHENICRGCGKTIRDGRVHCAQCAVDGATERLINAARVGRAIAHSPEARSKEGEKQHRHALARSSWKLSNLPPWLTAEVYSVKIQPLLSGISNSTIAAALGVSRCYAGLIRRGYRPHQRHWQALVELVRMTAHPATHPLE
jgi:CRISPR-associated endonuclease Cas1